MSNAIYIDETAFYELDVTHKKIGACKWRIFSQKNKSYYGKSD